MKILIVTGIYPPDHGGPASYVPAIAKALLAKHEIVSVVTLSDSLQHDDSCYPFPVVRIRRGQYRPFRWIGTILRIRELARRADVVYLNGLVLEGVIGCKLLSRRCVVAKVVGDLVWEKARNAGETSLAIEEFQRERLPLRWRLLRRLQGWYTRSADRILVPSKYLAGIVRGWGVGPHQIAVVYNAVENPRFGVVEKEWDVVTVTRLVPWKGVDVLIRLASVHGWRLLIVGDGPLRGALESLVDELSAQNRVRFTGNVPKESVATCIRSARVFILNSSYEGLPHIVLEAKGAGVPVIATAVGGTPETISDGVDGFLVRYGDTRALAETTESLLGDEELCRRIGIAGQNSVREQFSFTRMVLETERCFAEVVSGLQRAAPCAS